MPYSRVTRKGQTTIPKMIRILLKLKPMDKIVYVVDKGKVFLEPVSGDILDLKGILKPPSKPLNFKALRETAKKKISQKILKELR